MAVRDVVCLVRAIEFDYEKLHSGAGMIHRAFVALFVPLIAVPFTPMRAQTTQTTAPLPARAVRRDIPLTNTIRRAFAAGTRDSTGRPGRNYWQLWMDYTIAARLDPMTSTLTGRETIKLRNNE